jgi:REP element-mobilizing transposase RayT
MARPLRLEHEGAFWHVTSRGNERKNIFRSDADRLLFLALLAAAVERFNWIVHVYTLMSNHFHLVIETPERTLSRGMQWLNGQYACKFNKRHKRAGHLFQGRFHGELVQKESHLLELARYVVLNPVRAGMVARPEDYRWSSYRATVGVEAAPAWLTTDWILKQFSADRKRAVAAYATFVDAGVGLERSPWDDLVGQVFLGTAEWVERMQALIDEEPRSEEHPRAQRRVGRPTMEKVVAAVAKTFECTAEVVCTRALPAARMLAAWLGWRDGLLRLREIRAAFRLRSNGTISDLIRRCARELERDPVLRVAASACRELLSGAPPPLEAAPF